MGYSGVENNSGEDSLDSMDLGISDPEEIVNLENLERIGLISKEIREKILKTVSEESIRRATEEQFRKAEREIGENIAEDRPSVFSTERWSKEYRTEEKERRSEMERKALTGIFNSIYGKFLLEDTNSDPELSELLKKYFGDMTSPEAKIAFKYLRQYKLSKGRKDITETDDGDAEDDEAKSEEAKAKDGNISLSEIEELFKQSNITELSEGTEGNPKGKVKAILISLIKRQNPDLNEEKVNQEATLILQKNLALAATNKSYEELVRSSSPEVLKTCKLAAFKQRFINFRYRIKGQEGIVAPFKDLSPEDFDEPEKLKALFDTGKLNLRNGFFVLAMFEEFQEKGSRTQQSVQIEEILKRLLAKELEEELKGDTTEIDDLQKIKTIDSRFESKLKNARGNVKEISRKLKPSLKKWKKLKKKELELRMTVLREKLTLGEIDKDKFKTELQVLTSEKQKLGLDSFLDNGHWFSLNSIVNTWGNSPESQKIKDKTRSKAIMSMKLAGRASLGAGKLAVKSAFALGKYSGYLVGNLSLGLYNLFAKEKNKKYITRTRSVVWADIKKTVPKLFSDSKETIKSEWEKSEDESNQYGKRTKIDIPALEQEISAIQGQLDSQTIELNQDPFRS